MIDSVEGDYGREVRDYVADTLNTITYSLRDAPALYIERVRQMAAVNGDDRDVQRALNQIADRLVQGTQANIAAAQAERRQLAPPELEPREAQDLINVLGQEMNRIRDNYDEGIYNTVDGVLSLINNNFNVDTNPEMFIERVRTSARQAQTAGDMIMYDIYGHVADLLERTLRENNAIDRRPPPDIFAPVQDNAGLSPEYMTYLRTRLADARTGDEVTALERDFLQEGNPQGYSPAQIQTIERLIGERSRDILNENAPLQNPMAREFNDNMTYDQVVERFDEIVSSPNFMDEDIRNLRLVVNDPRNEVMRSLDQDTVDNLLQRIDRRLGNNVPALREPDNVGNVVQNLINQYPERNQIQALIDDLERGEISELPIPIQEADDFVRDATVSEILAQLEEYRDSIPAAQQVLLTGPQVADIVNREVERQSNILNLAPGNLRTFRNDMTDVTDFTDPQDMVNTLVSLRERYDDAGREGLRSAIGAILTQIDAQVRSNRQRGQVEQIEANRPQLPAPEVLPNVRYGNNVMDAYNGIMADNTDFNTFESLDALRALPQLIRRPGASRNSLGLGQFDAEHINQLARIFDALYDARYQQFVREGGNQLPPPEGRKDGGSIQSSKNRVLSPNVDEMRLALMKGK
jgi:hypothetical protein